MSTTTFQINRRNFLKTAAAISAATGTPIWFLEHEAAQAATPKPIGPNDRPGIALVGCGGQGRGDCASAQRFGEVMAVCDLDVSQAGQAAEQFKSGEKRPVILRDFRKVMERDDVQVIVCGTPDHWHTMVSLLAVRTGKDVYCEKPLTLWIDEGKRLVKAVREHQRILQVGSQQRSDRNFRLACELVRNGRIGKLRHIVVALPTGPREGPFPPQPVPFELNWDFYLGQAPYFPYNGKNAHWGFRWWYALANGMMTDWGAHHDDIAQWANGTDRSGPVEVNGRSLQDMIPGGYETAARFRIDMKYGNGVTLTIMDESTGSDRNVVGDASRTPNGVQLIGTEGWIFVTRGSIKASQQELIETPLPESALRLYRSSDHMGNFFDCVRSRKEPICDVEVGHRSASLAHLGVISTRMKQALKWNPDREEFVGENAGEANKWLTREMRPPYDWSFIG